MGRNRVKRERQLLRCIPTILDYKTLLYIGARKGLTQMLDLFINASYTIDILEIWPENVAGLKDLKGVRNIIEGDVRNVHKMNFTTYDIVMWWHGPEHVYWQELEKILNNLKKLSNKFVVIACPLGVVPQGGKHENLAERHVSSLYPEIFTGFGWETDTIGEVDVSGSNLLVWSKK